MADDSPTRCRVPRSVASAVLIAAVSIPAILLAAVRAADGEPKRNTSRSAVATAAGPGSQASNAAGAHAFAFRDVGDASGLFPDVAGVRGHAAGWGDVDGDGWLDLYVGAFHTDDTKPNQFFRGTGGGRFRLDDQAGLRISGRPTGSLLADLDNDGDLDLYVSSMPKPKAGAPRAGKPGPGNPAAADPPPLRGCALFRNDGGGRFADVSADNEACPPAFGGRSATVLDFDGDGLLDLLVGEDPLPGYNGSPTRSTRLFRNNGGLAFEDVTQAAGIPAGIPAYGVAAADVNGDTWPDLFLCGNGANVLFLNDGRGRFREAPGSREAFAWPAARGDDMVCGVAFADVNRDGRPDAVLGPHFEAPWRTPVPARLYLNRGVADGVPTFKDVTEAAGLKPLPMKAPHVELQDFDNDGWPDLYASMVKFADGRPHPLVYKHLGVRDGLPRFGEDVLAANDYPTDEDRAVRRAGTMFEKVLKEEKVIYMAAAPSGDFDNDGRLDLFMANWWAESRSLLLRNETPGGRWLDVRVEGTDGVNKMGVGAAVRIYPAGRLGDAAALLGSREVATGFGYASAQPATAHFGLADVGRVDVEVVLPHGKGTVVRKDVAADQRVTVKR